MGAQLEGRPLTLQQCYNLQDTFARKYFEHVSRQLDKVTTKHDPTFGLEIELVGVNDDYTFRSFDPSQFNANYAPEIMSSNVELVTDPLHHSSIDDLTRYIDTMKAGVQGPALQIGGHPSFNKMYATQLLSPHKRYQQLIEVLSETPTEFCAKLFNGTDYCSSGAQWEGIGTSFQFTVNTPIGDVADFYNAAKKLGPIALYATAASPFIDNMLSNMQSVRSIVIPAVTTAKHKKWRSLEPLNNPFRARSNLEQEMYRSLRNQSSSAIAKYFVESMREGWMLRTEGDEDNIVQPPPTFWPTVKLQGHIINEGGIPIEVRTAEQLANTHDTVHYMLGMHSMIMEEARRQKEGSSRSSSGKLDDANAQLVNRNRNIYWDEKVLHPIEIIKSFIPKMSNLQQLGYSSSDVRSVQEWWANRENDARQMILSALTVQPDLAVGKPLRQETLEQILEPHRL